MLKTKTRIKKIPKRALKRLDEIQKELNGPGKVKVGLPRDSAAYPDGTSLIMVGATHEFGSEKAGIPERSFLRSTVFENRRKYKAALKKLGRLIATGKMTADKALNLIGTMVQKDVRDKIASGIPPELSYRDGTALYDTGHLVKHIIYQIGDGDDN